MTTNRELAEQVARVESWLRTLPLMPADAPYLGNGMLAVDAVNAADVLREAADALREAQTALNVRQDEIDGLNGMLREAHAELADWKRVHGELAHASNETLEGMREVFTERDGLRAEVERLRALLREARIGLYGLGDDAVVARIDSELGEKK